MTDKEIEKENKIRFIKKFASMNLTKICRKVGIKRQGLYEVPCRVSLETINKICDLITEEISDLWEK